MAISYGGGNFFKNLNINVHTTIYGKKGDSSTRNLKMPGLSATTYARRHYVLSGEFSSSFPNSNVPDESGGVVGTTWPFADFKDVEAFTITAVKDNSSYHCITTVGKNHIEHEEYEIADNSTFLATQGRIYIASVDCTVNGETHKAGSVLACENGDAELTFTQGGKVTAYSSVADL
jgi:hypothetical protein